MDRFDCYVGQRVRIVNTDRYDGFGTIQKLNPKNIKVMLDSGSLLTAHPSFLEPATDAPLPPPVERKPYVSPPVLGAFVRVSDLIVRRTPALAGVWVVVGANADKTRIAQPGGDDNRYWRIPHAELTTVKVNYTEVSE